METIQTLLNLLALHGGRIVNTADLTAEQINQARASGRMYVSDDALGYVWEPPISRIPETEDEVKWLEHWYPLAAELPEHLKDPSFLFNQGEAPERTASQQVPDQGDAAGLQILSLQSEIEQLTRDRHELVIALRRLQCYCKGQVKAYETSTRYREVEALLDQHHHSTETL